MDRDEGALRPARRRTTVRTVGVALLAAMTAAGCSPRFDWREVGLTEQRCVVALPGKPQRTEREVDLPAGRATMSMTSTGVGATLFAVGVVALPPAAAGPADLEATVTWLRDGLVRNLGGRLTGVGPAALKVPVGRSLRLGQAIGAEGRAGADGRKAVLAARIYVVDDLLFQVIAIGGDGELSPLVLDTFFDSFRLTE